MTRLIWKFSWKSFNSFYLNELRQHHLNVKTKSSPSSQPTVGDVVIIWDDIPLPRHRWRLGKIIYLVYVRDNKVRGVQLKSTTDSKNTEAFRPTKDHTFRDKRYRNITLKKKRI